jgi:carboxymethylenebutenolidase
MSEWVNLKAQDGHELDAYVAYPAVECIGGIVLIQEIFGVNEHIQRIANQYAEDGFTVIAPALFDRIQRSVQLKYEGEDMKKAIDLMQRLSPDTSLMDIAAAYGVAKQTERGVAVIGYCYGGMLSWLTATRGEDLKMRPDCCVGYYPGGIGKFATEEPSCPVMLHFGGDDSHIGQDQIEAVRSAHPEVEIYIYDGAQHAFNCDSRTSFNPSASKLARERTLAFLKTHIA